VSTAAVGALPMPVVPVAGVLPPGAVGATGLEGLPAPDLLPASLTDLPSMMQKSMEATAQKLEITQGQLDEVIEELSAALEEAAKAAAEAAEQEDDDSFWGAVCSFVSSVADVLGDFIGKVVGSVADFTVDLAMAPFDLVAALVQGKSFADALRSIGDNLTSNGHIADTVHGFTQGVAKFAASVALFVASSAKMVAAGLSGENMLDAMKGEFAKLRQSAQENLIDNPAMLEMACWALKGVAIAGAVASGGMLGAVAVDVLLLSELNKRYGIAEKLLGPEIGAKVTLALEVASAVLLGVAGGALDQFASIDFASATSAIENTALVVQGSLMLGGAISRYQSANAGADELEQQADLKTLSNRLTRLQRAIESIIEELGDKSEDKQRIMKGASKVTQIQAASFEAALFRA
jgi:hypothetical protein